MPAAQKPDLAGLEEIGDSGGSLTGIAAATRYGEDQVAEGKLGSVGFAKVFFHKGSSVFIGTGRCLANDMPRGGLSYRYRGLDRGKSKKFIKKRKGGDRNWKKVSGR